MKEPAPIDLDHLRRQAMDDTDLQREALGLYRQELRRSVRDITGESGQARVIAAHRLVGASLAIGAFPMAALARLVENGAAEPAGSKLAQAAVELDGSIDAVLAALQR